MELLITSCSYKLAAEQKARLTYDNILRLSDDPDVNNVIRFLREREVVHFQRFGDTNRTKLSRFQAASSQITALTDRDFPVRRCLSKAVNLPLIGGIGFLVEQHPKDTVDFGGMFRHKFFCGFYRYLCRFLQRITVDPG